MNLHEIIAEIKQETGHTIDVTKLSADLLTANNILVEDNNYTVSAFYHRISNKNLAFTFEIASQNHDYGLPTISGLDDKNFKLSCLAENLKGGNDGIFFVEEIPGTYPYFVSNNGNFASKSGIAVNGKIYILDPAKLGTRVFTGLDDFLKLATNVIDFPLELGRYYNDETGRKLATNFSVYYKPDTRPYLKLELWHPRLLGLLEAAPLETEKCGIDLALKRQAKVRSFLKAQKIIDSYNYVAYYLEHLNEDCNRLKLHQLVTPEKQATLKKHY